MPKPIFAEEELRQKTKQLYQKAQEQIAQQEADKYSMPYIDANKVKVQLDALRLISEEDARAYQIAGIQLKDQTLIAVTTKPLDDEARQLLTPIKKRHEVDLYFVSPQGFLHVLDFYKQIPKPKAVVAERMEVSAELMEKYQRQITTLSQMRERLSGVRERQKISQALEMVFGGALAIDASDVHLEPKEEEAQLKFRIDGMLQQVTTVNLRAYKMLTSRIKLLSGMKLNVRATPQDGRFSIATPEAEIEIRTSTLPGPYGENLVLRILNPKTIGLKLEQLGLLPFEEELIGHELKKPNGLILVTGPTGSGKTTSLYAFLKKVNEEPGLKIITIEDPIEYRLPGIEQTQVEPKKGYDFANGLRSILRQDPDIILVGEMRDLDTVQIALHASLTGHLVFSTLHTNDSAGIIPRLIDMGAQVPIIAPAVNTGIAQRLVRKVCPHCSKKGPASPDLVRRLREILKSMPEVYMKRPEVPDKLEVSLAVGCSLCNDTGYKGRIGVFEIFLIEEEMERLIMSRPSDVEVKELARKKGMVTMKEDGALKVLQGITTLEEVERVVG